LGFMQNCDLGGAREFLFCSTLIPTASKAAKLLDLIFRCRAGARRRAGLKKRPGHEVQPYAGVGPNRSVVQRSLKELIAAETSFFSSSKSQRLP